MATLSGTNATVKIGSYTVADMASWSLEDNRDALTAPVFGDEFNKVHGMGTRTQTGVVEGFLNVDDTTGQIALETAYAAGTKLTDFYLFIDDTEYYRSDTASDADAGVYISSMTIGARQNEIIPVTFNFACSGEFDRA